MTAPEALASLSEWCDVHAGWVDEGRTRRLEGQATRICDACATERGELTTLHIDVPALAAALASALNPDAPIEDRAAAYAVLYNLQLRVNRVLRNAPSDTVPSLKEALTGYLQREGGGTLGELYLKWVPEKVKYPCNDPGNWVDAGVQGAMATLAADRDTALFIRHIPDHLEVDTVTLGKLLVLGDAAAHELWEEMKRQSWRTEEGTLSPHLKVRQ